DFSDQLQVVLDEPLHPAREPPELPAHAGAATAIAIVESWRPGHVDPRQSAQRRRQAVIHFQEPSIVPERLTTAGGIRFVTRQELPEQAGPPAVDVQVRADTQRVIAHPTPDQVRAVEQQKACAREAQALREVEVEVAAGGFLRLAVAPV